MQGYILMLLRVVLAAMTGPTISVLHNRTLVITHESLTLTGGFPLLGDSGTWPLSISRFCFPLGLRSPRRVVGRQERECEEGTKDTHTASAHLTLSGQAGQEYVLSGWVASSKRHNTMEERSGFWCTAGHIRPSALPSCVILGKFTACPGLSPFVANAAPVRLLQLLNDTYI